MALSTGQITDTFQNTLKRAPTGAELAKYSAMGDLEGPAGQQSLASMIAGSGGGSSGGTGFDPAASYQSAYQTAKSLVPALDTSSLDEASANITAAAQAKSASLLATIPDVQNIYTDMAKQLAATFQSDTETAQKNKSVAVSSSQASQAAEGIDTTTGFGAALNRSIAADQDKIIANISTQYGISSEQLANEEAKDIDTLKTEAADAILSGATDVANITYQIIGLKQKQQDLISTAASDILAADTTAEKNALTAQYQAAILDDRQQTINLEATRLGLQYPGGGGKINIATLTTYGMNTLGLSQSDATAIINNGVNNGESQQEIQQDLMDYAGQQTSAAASAKTSTSSGNNILGNLWGWVTSHL